MALLLTAVCAFGASAVHAEEAASLLRNGGIESIDAGSGLPDGWTQDVYAADANGATVSTLSVGQDGGYGGQGYLSVANMAENDARWIQTVAVEADSVYKLTGWIRVTGGLADRSGGNLSVLGIAAPFPAVGDTQGEWRQVEWYGKTGKDQTSIVVAARLGSYGSLNSGRADFDDLSLEEVAEAPAGAVVIPLWPEAYSGAASGGEQAGGGHGAYKGLMFLLAAAYAALAWGIVAYLRRAGSASLLAGETSRRRGVVLLIFSGALLVRVACAPIMQGHPIDALDFYFWANHAYEAGLHGFYTADIFVDYPPGYIYVLYVIGILQKLMHIGYPSAGSALLLKLPSIAADLAASYILLRLARPRFGAAAGTAIASLYLFNPMVFHNSVVWGQIDSFLALFILLAVWAIVAGKLPYATAAVVAAVLIKPQAIVAIPVLLIALVVCRSRKAWGQSLLYGAAAFVLLVLPFSLRQDPGWIAERYRAMFDSYPYATLNAANLYGLLGLNGIKVTAAMALWSNLSVVLIVAYIAWLTWKHRKREAAPVLAYLAYVTFLLVFAFKTSMHERYGYPAVALAILAFILLKDRRLLWMFLGLTFTHFADAAYVLYFGLDKHYYLSANDGFFRFLSLVNLAITAYAVYVGWTLDKSKPIAVPASTPSVGGKSGKHGKDGKDGKLLAQTDPKTAAPPLFGTVVSKADAKLNRLDRWLVVGLTLVYGILALVNLGSMRAPESGWTPAAPASAIVYDFGDRKPVASVIWYGGTRDAGRAEDSAVELSQSADGTNWSSVMTFMLNGGSVFQWKEQNAAIDQRYVRVTASNPGWTLYELAFRDADGNLLTPNKTSEGGDRLLDEQGDVPKKPSYLNSMYFDEIYHGRTAYEFLHHIEPYETTHPPLGKGLMALGVSLFGMNPFGWRIMGTLLGIAMVPLMYLLGKRLFGRTEFAFAASFLMTFDFMHFTQTRIATVDVYGVFFILLMYLYMYKYYVRALAGESFRSVALPLALAGLFFGLGAASKWIDIYAGGGLAVLFAFTLWKRRKEPSFLLRATLWCVPFFLVVPALIYTASYIPFFLVPGPGHGFHDMLTYQKFMYNYHAHLVATHPFASSWWEWPLMVKPIWYYGGSVAANQVSSIVAMGNPAVWWIGIGTVAAAVVLLFRGRARDPRLVFLLVGLAAQYLPWVGVTRLTFIYHFFASVPFVVLLIVYVMKEGTDRGLLKRGHVYGYLGAVLLLFILFYPILSGMTVDKSYVAHTLRWFQSWIFNS